MARQPPFSEGDARHAIRASRCWADALRRLGYESRGQNFRTLKRHAERWAIPTDHFDPHLSQKRAGKTRLTPLNEVLVAGSSYARGTLKRRLYAEGLKQRKCEQCGQEEEWNGRKMSLILDHINGVSNDNRIENLRILCPNCAATLDTHCARNLPRQRACAGCGEMFAPSHIRHRYCTLKCWGAVRSDTSYVGPGASRGIPRPETRKVLRPTYWVLLSDIEELGYRGTGRKYGVSDNTIRKWLDQYDHELASGDVSIA
jgi:hypothetical protein